MPLTRRNTIKAGGAALLSAAIPTGVAKARKAKRILVLGGTVYLGPAVVEAALARGHEVTLFNRGVTNPQLFPDVEKLRGEREVASQNLDALSGNRIWDAVIDTWPADPRMVQNAATLLLDRTQHYGFISTIAVYKDKSVPGITEKAPLWDINAYDPDLPYRETKVLCERAVQEAFPSNHLIVRPPGIFGKRDESWSFVYWLWRMRAGGPVLAPGDGSDPVQWIDVKDVAAFMLHAIDDNLTGTFNTIGPQSTQVTFKHFLERLNRFHGNRAELIWVDQEFLERKELRPIIDLPMWVPITRLPGRYTMSAQKAIDAGMIFTPMEQTFASALNWYDEVKSPDSDPGLDKNRPFNGITRTRELELLAEWRAENG